MPKKDYLIGKVMEIVDGETFRMAVARIGRKTMREYGKEERVFIKKFRLRDIVWITGVFTKPQLEKMFKGRQVLCLVDSRGRGGRIEAEVQLI